MQNKEYFDNPSLIEENSKQPVTEIVKTQAGWEYFCRNLICMIYPPAGNCLVFLDFN